MGKVIIREPMRDGFIGLNQKHISDPDLIIEISFVNRKGERLWPYQYRLNREKIPSYRTHTIRRGGRRVELVLVPLYDLIRIAE